MCSAMEELWEEGFERGCEEGHKTQALLTAKNLAQLGMSVEQIAEAINFNPEVVSGWLGAGTISESVN